jgi:hypothetical protein
VTCDADGARGSRGVTTAEEVTGMGVRAGLVARLLGAAIFSVTIMAAAGTASAATQSKPEDRKGPAFLTGTATGSHTTSSEPIPPYPEGYTSIDRWQVDGLELKRERVVVLKRQTQRIYRVTDGTVTWRHEHSGGCLGPGGFTETFSLKGVRWDRDSRITFFAPNKGRFRNRWRVDGQLDLIREKQVGVCQGSPANAYLPSLVSGTGVGKTPPVARPGKKVQLRFASRWGAGTVFEHEDTLTIRIPR